MYVPVRNRCANKTSKKSTHTHGSIKKKREEDRKRKYERMAIDSTVLSISPLEINFVWRVRLCQKAHFCRNIFPFCCHHKNKFKFLRIFEHKAQGKLKFIHITLFI